MSRYEIAQPTNDIAFKKLFANPNDTFILIDFLNSVLEQEYKMTIDEVKTVESVNLPDGHGGKLSAFDVRCIDNLGRNFIVEMQVLGTGWSKERAQWYVSQVYYKQLEESQKYKEAQPVFLIAILGFDMFPSHDRYISYHTVRDTVDNKRYLEAFNFAFIELKKFKKQAVETLNEKVASWCLFFNEYFNDEVIDNLCKKSEAIKKATKVLKMHNWEPQERAIYEKLKLISWDIELTEEFAKKNNEQWIKAAEEKIEESKKKIEESKKTIEESKKTIEIQAQELEATKNQVLLAKLEALEAKEKTRQAKVEIAKNLLATGMSVKEVAVFTGLDEKELKKL